MPTTNELRLALRDADESLTPHYRDHTRKSARTLAAAYREAIEALREVKEWGVGMNVATDAMTRSVDVVLAKAEEAENGKR